MKVCISCALTHVPRELFSRYVDFIHSLAESITKEAGTEVMYALKDSDPQLAEKPIQDRSRLCYIWDREMVEWADLVVAEVSFPSTGVGIELQIAESRNIPIILCFSDFGINKVNPVEYENPDHTRHHLQVGEGYVTLMALGLPNIFHITNYADKMDGISKVLETIEVLRRESD